MRITPAKTLSFTDAAGAVLFSAPMPCLAQIEACIRLEPDSAADARGAAIGETPRARQRRLLAQCVVLLCPPVLEAYLPIAQWQAWRQRRRAARWLRSLQYPQLLDVYRKLMLTVQGIDFDTVEEFERALDAQKKSTDTAPLKSETTSSPDSTN